MTCGTTVYRVQGPDGRGPFRPGLTRIWADEEFAPGMQHLPSWIQEFGLGLLDRIEDGEYVGCGVRTLKQLNRWFSEAELGRLRMLGFEVVALKCTKILAESENQMVFATRMPLSHAQRVLVQSPELP